MVSRLLEDFDAEDYMPEERAFKSAKTWARQREYKRHMYRQFKEVHELASNGTYSPTWDQWQAATEQVAREQERKRRAVEAASRQKRNTRGATRK
ncbi:hypothetical protein AS590_10645 [Prescottella equi]|nr:hypothetical protein AS590_10645 [Prescottella equi]